MKKCISVLIILLLLSSCLGLTVSAANTSATISEDYKTMVLDGNRYSRADVSALSVTLVSFNELNAENVALTEAQKESLKNITFLANETKTVILADFSFKDGSTLSVGFLQDDYRDEYESLLSNASSQCAIEFFWPEGNQVATQLSQLKGKAATLTDRDFLEFCEFFNVTAHSSDGSLAAIKGSLLIYDDQYYYVDFEENGIIDPPNFYPDEFGQLKAYQVTNEELIKSITDAMDAYYSDSFGLFFDDTFTKGLSAVFLVFVFAVIPAVTFVAAIICIIRTKGFYRRLWIAITALSASELTIFAILTAIILSVQ